MKGRSVEAAATFNAILLVLALVLVAGCSGDEGAAQDVSPKVMDRSDVCEVCGMTIVDQPGPRVQVFFREHSPRGHPNPAVLDSIDEAIFYIEDHESAGWEPVGIYVTDYSEVDYKVKNLTGVQQRRVISSHRNHYVAAQNATFVSGSEISGAMGEEPIPFSKRPDAEAFRDKYGGELATWADLREER